MLLVIETEAEEEMGRGGDGLRRRQLGLRGQGQR